MISEELTGGGCSLRGGCQTGRIERARTAEVMLAKWDKGEHTDDYSGRRGHVQ